MVLGCFFSKESLSQSQTIVLQQMDFLAVSGIESFLLSQTYESVVQIV